MDERAKAVDELYRLLGELEARVAPVCELLPLLEIPTCDPARAPSTAQDAEVLNPDPKRDAIWWLVEHARRSKDEARSRPVRRSPHSH